MVPSKRTLLIGRSPICDLVLRSNEMRPMHFLIEWVGEGDFKPNEGFWSLVDISKSTAIQSKDFSGEAAILQKNPIQFEGFEFLITKDDLAETAVSKGVISRSMDFESEEKKILTAGQSMMLELITYDRRNDVVTNVNHFDVELLSRGLRITTLPQLSFNLPSVKNNILIAENLGEINLVDVYRRSEKITSEFKGLGKKIEIAPGDFISFLTAESAYYFRWVPRVAFIPPPRVWTKDPAVLTLLGVFFFIGITAVLMSQVKLPEVTEIPEPKRIARVEIAATAPEPPPPPPPLSEAAEQVVTPPQPPQKEVEEKPAPTLSASEEEKNTKKNNAANVEKIAVPAAPKGDPKKASVKNTDKKNTNVGLDSPAAIKDVNTVGLLSKLKGGKKSTDRLSAEQVVNRGKPTDSAVGETGSVALNQAPLGQIGASKNKGSSSSSEGPGLAGASTTLRSNKASENPSIGGLAGSRGKGKFGGEGMIGKPTGGGSGGFGLDAHSMEVSGGLTKEDIRNSLRENQRAIRNCYERALLSKNHLEGRLGLRWKINPSGIVESISIQNTTVGMPSLENCVLEVVKRISFPQAPNKQPTTVIYPFVFTPKKN
ncbi:MAG: AgmX/PglI C-terminal domain-containing protein [Bdellovibrionota bacterium]